MWYFYYCLVAKSCPALCNSMHYSPPGSSVHGDIPDKNSGVGWHFLFQEIFLTQKLNPETPPLSPANFHPIKTLISLNVRVVVVSYICLNRVSGSVAVHCFSWFSSVTPWASQSPLPEGMLVRALPAGSFQFSCSVVSDSLQPRELQHTRPHCPSPTPRVYLNSCPLSRWCHPTISSSIIPFSSCLQSFPTSGSFQMSQLFTSCGQNIGVSGSTSVLPMNTQDWSPLGWTGWISLQSKGLSRVFSNTTVQKHQFFGAQLSSQSNPHIHTWLLEKP